MGRVVIPGFRKIETGGEGGTTNYNDLTNKPSINNVPLVGNLSTVDLKLTDKTLTEEGVPAEAKTVGTKLEEQSSNLTSEISRAKETEETLKSRIDNIASLPEGSTTGDAELQDIRVKADGTTATSAGNAIREQVSELREDLVDLEKDIDIFQNNYYVPLCEDEIETLLNGDIFQMDYSFIQTKNTSKEYGVWSGIKINRRYLKHRPYNGAFYLLSLKRIESLNTTYGLVLYVNNSSNDSTGKLFTVSIGDNSTRTHEQRITGGTEQGSHVTLLCNNDETIIVTLNGLNTIINLSTIPVIPDRLEFGYWEKCQLGILTQSNDWSLVYEDLDVYYAFGDSMTYGSLTDGDGSHLIGQSTIRYPEYFGEKHYIITYNKSVPGQGYLNVSAGTNALGKIQNTNISNANLITLAFGLNDHTHHRTKLGTLNADNPDTILGQLKECLAYIWAQNPTCKVIVIGTTTRLGEYA